MGQMHNKEELIGQMITVSKKFSKIQEADKRYLANHSHLREDSWIWDKENWEIQVIILEIPREISMRFYSWKRQVFHLLPRILEFSTRSLSWYFHARYFDMTLFQEMTLFFQKQWHVEWTTPKTSHIR